jgi:DNA repair protein RecO (recombination protein O)
MASTLAYVLHTRPWRETSLLVDALTPDFGRIALIAKGAKRPHSPLRGLLEPFTPVAIQFSGKLGIKNLTQAHWVQAINPLHPAHTIQGWYLSELCLRTLGEDDPQAAVFAAYDAALRALIALPEGDDSQALLRQFEVQLLMALGLWPDASGDAQGQPLQAQALYTLDEATGWQRASRETAPWVITGEQIIALSLPQLQGKPQMQAQVHPHEKEIPQTQTQALSQQAARQSLPNLAPSAPLSTAQEDKLAVQSLRIAMRAMLARALHGKALSTRAVWMELDAIAVRS